MAIDIEALSKSLVCVVNEEGTILFDITPHIVMPSYKVNYKREFYEWEDMKHEVHRRVKRDTVSGSFDVFIDDTETLTEFVLACNPLRSSVQLFVVPTEVVAFPEEAMTDWILGYQSTRSFGDYAVSYSLINDIPYYGIKKHSPISVTISNKIAQTTNWQISVSPTNLDEEPKTPTIIGE